MRKLGILGGTFNPIHAGHIRMGELALAALSLDRVLYLPSGKPPHKSAEELASADDRLDMVALALNGRERFVVSDAEIRREGTSYTIDTLELLREANPDCELTLIIGSDALERVGGWYRAGELGAMCDLFVVPRRDANMTALRALADDVAGRLKLGVTISQERGYGVSSSDVRSELAKGRYPEDTLPVGAWDYVRCHALYGAGYNDMAKRLKGSMSEARFRHTLSVARCAVALAVRHGVNPAAAHLAGMLHDCAKGQDAQTLRRMIREGGISADDLELSMPALLHAPAGVYLARKNYHVTDSAVLSAIRWHTTGRRNMTKLEKVVYLADAIEPDRLDVQGLSAIREAAYDDLDGAVRMSAERTAQYVNERGKKLHARTAELTKRDK